MLEMKSCPRCHGDMLANRDMYGYYKQCLQCGFMIDLEPPEKVGVHRFHAADSEENDAA